MTESTRLDNIGPDYTDNPASESEETCMARLHSLLTKSRSSTSDPSPPPRKKNLRRTQMVQKDSQNISDGQMHTLDVLDPTPPHTPSRTDYDRAVKPSPRLTRSKWRAAAMIQYHQKGLDIRSRQQHNDPNIFPFQALPPELRMAVYFELLVTDDRILPTWRGARKATKQQKRMHINILLTCKMCHDEGLQVLYGENIFDFGEICNRPNNFSKPFVARIGLHTASLIRIVFAEYSAASEELSQSDTTPDARRLHDSKPTQLSVAHLRTFFSTFGISLPSLRLLAISIMPYGNDQATDDLLKLADPEVRSDMDLRMKWLDAKNGKERLAQLVDGICKREKGLVKANYWTDVDGWIGISFAPPSSGREWIVYQGVRGKEGNVVDGKEEDDTEEGGPVEGSAAPKAALVLHRV
ncbi:uncharacterized protein CC84DRAFT_1212282 [Paraphaeosphaeria sporulosa]|uniref:Uncharacterized protein n=1 Tax=Paraphaeosphaeria sporulosa TaxID=1460663 RepID=A0A177D041_9PLEO|nr:uncharacterized protein CC84DRAFT_1212282 [Paraphaeosphaeria sporulosa]OAG12781.1 hypothetical protein CC84DRAFT_1212282 [Paraphaeosphaeria sporulosa]